MENTKSKCSVVEKRENHAVLICKGTYKGEYIIDLDIADEIAKHSWNVNCGGFIKTKIKGQAVTLQRFILGAEKAHIILKKLKVCLINIANEQKCAKHLRCQARRIDSYWIVSFNNCLSFIYDNLFQQNKIN